jgi:hypothetical protein
LLFPDTLFVKIFHSFVSSSAIRHSNDQLKLDVSVICPIIGNGGTDSPDINLINPFAARTLNLLGFSPMIHAVLLRKFDKHLQFQQSLS